jgi:hypothetical protein
MTENSTDRPPLTVGELMVILQHADLPDDAEVVVLDGDPQHDDVRREHAPVDVTALKGFRQPSRLMIHLSSDPDL